MVRVRVVFFIVTPYYYSDMKTLMWAVLTAAVSLMASCTGHGDAAGVEAYTDTVYAPEFASGFVVRCSPCAPGRLIEVCRPWQFADTAQARCLLLLGAGEEAPGGFTGQVIHGPARRVVAMSTTQIAMLDAFGAADVVEGVSGLGFVANQSVRRRLGSNADVGYEGNVDYERLVALQPDVVLLYGVSGPSVMEDKLRDIGIPYIYIGDYVEDSPLGKAEWMVLLGELTGRRDEARWAFEGIADRYEHTRLEAARLDPKPAVMVNLPYNGTWFLPSASSYVARLVEDAGGRLVFNSEHSGGSAPVDIERAYMLADSADVWINTGAATSLGELLAVVPDFRSVRPVRARAVYNSTCRMTPGGGNDYFESGSVNPDRVLADLACIMRQESGAGRHDSSLRPVDSLYYYVRLR